MRCSLFGISSRAEYMSSRSSCARWRAWWSQGLARHSRRVCRLIGKLTPRMTVNPPQITEPYVSSGTKASKRFKAELFSPALRKNLCTKRMLCLTCSACRCSSPSFSAISQTSRNVYSLGCFILKLGYLSFFLSIWSQNFFSVAWKSCFLSSDSLKWFLLW